MVPSPIDFCPTMSLELREIIGSFLLNFQGLSGNVCHFMVFMMGRFSRNLEVATVWSKGFNILPRRPLSRSLK